MKRRKKFKVGATIPVTRQEELTKKVLKQAEGLNLTQNQCRLVEAYVKQIYSSKLLTSKAKEARISDLTSWLQSEKGKQESFMTQKAILWGSKKRPIETLKELEREVKRYAWEMPP